jgi:hypothetical protein
MPIPMKTTIFTKCFAVVLAAGIASFAGTAEAAIVSLDAPFTLDGNYGTKYLNFDGTSLTGSGSRGPNSVTMQNIYTNFRFSDAITESIYAFNNGTNAALEFNYGDVISAATTDFSYGYNQPTVPSDSGLTYFVVGFFNNVDVTSFPSTSPNNAFIAGSNLAWMAVSRTGGNITVEAAGVNTVAGGSIAVGEYVAPSTSSVPEIDPNSLGSVLALVLGSLGLLERRRLKAA